MTAVPILNAANWFVEKAMSERRPVTPMKLQKLLYYAQGYWMAYENEELFDKDFHRWDWGPVSPNVYKKFKLSGSSVISYVCPEGNAKELSPRVIQFLQQIWDVFGKFSAIQLSEMSHQESPWIDTPPQAVIPKEEIKAYFKGVISTNRVPASAAG